MLSPFTPSKDRIALCDEREPDCGPFQGDPVNAFEIKHSFITKTLYPTISLFVQ